MAVFGRLEGFASGLCRAFCVSRTYGDLGCGAFVLLCVINAIANGTLNAVVYVLLFH